MKRLIIALTLLTIALPVSAKEPNFFPLITSQGLGDPFATPKQEPLKRTNPDEVKGDATCIDTNYDTYCGKFNKQTGIYEIEDSFLYNNCSRIGGTVIDDSCVTYGDDEYEHTPALIEIRDWQGGN